MLGNNPLWTVIAGRGLLYLGGLLPEITLYGGLDLETLGLLSQIMTRLDCVETTPQCS